MIRFYFSVLDSASSLYGQPFLAPTVGSAMRSLGDEAKRKDSIIGAHPEHFSLHRIGSFDDESGVISPEATPVFVAKATDFLSE